MIYCDEKKNMMPMKSPINFFIEGLRLSKSSITESFSLAAEGHCMSGRFRVELPTRISGTRSALLYR